MNILVKKSQKFIFDRKYFSISNVLETDILNRISLKSPLNSEQKSYNIFIFPTIKIYGYFEYREFEIINNGHKF